MTTGGQRIHLFNELTAAMTTRGLNPDESGLSAMFPLRHATTWWSSYRLRKIDQTAPRNRYSQIDVALPSRYQPPAPVTDTTRHGDPRTMQKSRISNRHSEFRMVAGIVLYTNSPIFCSVFCTCSTAFYASCMQHRTLYLRFNFHSLSNFKERIGNREQRKNSLSRNRRQREGVGETGGDEPALLFGAAPAGSADLAHRVGGHLVFLLHVYGLTT